MRKCKSKWETEAIQNAIFLQDKARDILDGKVVVLIVGLKRYKAKFGLDGALLIEEI